MGLLVRRLLMGVVFRSVVSYPMTVTSHSVSLVDVTSDGRSMCFYVLCDVIRGAQHSSHTNIRVYTYTVGCWGDLPRILNRTWSNNADWVVWPRAQRVSISQRSEQPNIRRTRHDDIIPIFCVYIMLGLFGWLWLGCSDPFTILPQVRQAKQVYIAVEWIDNCIQFTNNRRSMSESDDCFAERLY